MTGTPPPYADPRRVLAAAAIVALHAAVLLLIQRQALPRIPAAGPLVYADLLFVPAPRPISLPPAPAERTPRTTSATRTRPAPPPEPIASAVAAAPTAPIPAAPLQQPVDPTGAAQAPQGKLDVAALVAAAGENERRRRKEPLERLQDSQRIRAKEDSDAARAIAKTGRADCTKKYAGGPNLDPLKLIPLLYDTLTDTGCKW